MSVAFLGPCRGCGRSGWFATEDFLCDPCAALEEARALAWARQYQRAAERASPNWILERQLGAPSWGERVFDFAPRQPGFFARLRAWWTRPWVIHFKRQDTIPVRPPDPPAMRLPQMPIPLACEDYSSSMRPRPTSVPSSGTRVRR